MNSLRVTDILQIRNRFIRSIHIERDFDDNNFKDYIITPHSKDMLERIIAGLVKPSSQRAWRITGDYGTGKSSFGLALTHALVGQNEQILSQLDRSFYSSPKGSLRPHLLPVLVTGSREPITLALLRSLNRALERCNGKIQPDLREKIRPLLCSGAPSISDTAIFGILEEVIGQINQTGVGEGLLIIIDELGKFLEFAALHPDRQDVFFLQNLAEAAARSGKHPIVVVGLLHQGFNAYAEQLSQVMQKEWEKVAGRFEEVLFNQPIEQVTYLVAEALNIRLDRLPKTVTSIAMRDMALLIDMGWFGPAVPRKNLLEIAARLYPIHPSAIPVLYRLFSRFGQNERSLFSFLLSNEPFAIQDFSIQPIHPTTFYRTHHLYDYMRVAFGSRLSVQSYRSHWNQIESVVESFPPEHSTELQVLKTVALLNLLDVPSLLATDDVLAIAVGNGKSGDLSRVKEAIRSLQREKHVLYYRGRAGGYCLWPHTSVNLEKAYKEACQSVDIPQRISVLIQRNIQTRPLVARRHYIETGNLRHFDVRYTPVSDLRPSFLEEEDTADGYIIVPLGETEEERQEAIVFAQSATFKKHSEVLVAIPKPLEALAGLVEECLRWEWISQNVPELNNDTYASEEVSRQIQASHQILEKRIRSYIGLRQFNDPMELQWFHKGCMLPIDSGRELLTTISEICDDTYDKAPKIHNELVNRRTLSSAAAAARMRLIERILENPTQPFLGMDSTKKPPEMSMYLSVLKRAGLHLETNGRWVIQEPKPGSDPCNLYFVFQCIIKILKEKPDNRVRVSDIFKQLRGSPFGVRDGLTPLLLAVFTALHEHDVAFYEDGAFLRRITGPEFLRLIKAPESFEVQYCRVTGVRVVVFEELFKLLYPGCQNSDSTDILDVVRPLCEFAAQLPVYTRRTTTLSQKTAAVREALLRAEEPALLVFQQLPVACDMKPFKSDHPPNVQMVKQFIEELRTALDELRLSYPELLNKLKENVLSSFDRPSSFERIRTSLANSAERLLIAVTEPRLKAFCLRLNDHSLSEQAWLESLASFICSKPPEKWLDRDTMVFRDELSQLAGRFRRVEATVFQNQKCGEVSAMRVAITSHDGTEVDQIIYLDGSEEVKVSKMEKSFLQTIRADKRLGLVAASRAIRKYLEESNR